MYYKNFDNWNTVKQGLHYEEKTKSSVRAGEIRWTSFGVNIGSEIDGKGGSFTRPVLIIHTIGNHLALVVPMSTKMKHVAGYLPFFFRKKIVSLCIHQMRIVSQRRIFSRLLKVPVSQLKLIKTAISAFYSFPSLPYSLT